MMKIKYPSVKLGGRLGSYCYYDMDDVVAVAFKCFEM